MVARLGFSVAAYLDPEILLIDEVLAVGDFSFQKKCMRRIMDFKKQGVTIFYVSHMMESVIQFCDRALLIDEHRVKIDRHSGESCRGIFKRLNGGNKLEYQDPVL